MLTVAVNQGSTNGRTDITGSTYFGLFSGAVALLFVIINNVILFL